MEEVEVGENEAVAEKRTAPPTPRQSRTVQAPASGTTSATPANCNGLKAHLGHLLFRLFQATVVLFVALLLVPPILGLFCLPLVLFGPQLVFLCPPLFFLGPLLMLLCTFAAHVFLRAIFLLHSAWRGAALDKKGTETESATDNNDQPTAAPRPAHPRAPADAQAFSTTRVSAQLDGVGSFGAATAHGMLADTMTAAASDGCTAQTWRALVKREESRIGVNVLARMRTPSGRGIIRACLRDSPLGELPPLLVQGLHMRHRWPNGKRRRIKPKDVDEYVQYFEANPNHVDSVVLQLTSVALGRPLVMVTAPCAMLGCPSRTVAPSVAVFSDAGLDKTSEYAARIKHNTRKGMPNVHLAFSDSDVVILLARASGSTQVYEGRYCALVDPSHVSEKLTTVSREFEHFLKTTPPSVQQPTDEGQAAAAEVNGVFTEPHAAHAAAATEEKKEEDRKAGAREAASAEDNGVFTEPHAAHAAAAAEEKKEEDRKAGASKELIGSHPLPGPRQVPGGGQGEGVGGQHTEPRRQEPGSPDKARANVEHQSKQPRLEGFGGGGGGGGGVDGLPRPADLHPADEDEVLVKFRLSDPDWVRIKRQDITLKAVSEALKHSWTM